MAELPNTIFFGLLFVLSAEYTAFVLFLLKVLLQFLSEIYCKSIFYKMFKNVLSMLLLIEKIPVWITALRHRTFTCSSITQD